MSDNRQEDREGNMPKAETNDNKKPGGRIIWIVLTAVFAVGFIVCGISVGVTYYQRTQAEKALRELVEEINQTPAAEPETIPASKEPETIVPEDEDVLAELGIEIPDKELDFAKLREEVNPDIYAWLYIPDTTIDYPIVQHPDNDIYYLDYNLDGSKGYPGCIFSELINSKDFTDPQTVLYGHNLKAAFGNLHKFEDKEYFEEHPYMYVYTEEKTFVYKIFGAYENLCVHLIYNFDVNNEQRFQEYLDGVRSIKDMTANFDQDVELKGSDNILTLSTCIKNKKNMRYLVQGVLLNP